MTVRQIIQEIETLSPEERQEVLDSLQQRLKENEAQYKASVSTGVRYLDLEKACPLIKEVLTEHSELFCKLAQ